MKFIKKIKFKSFKDIKKSLNKCFVLHAIPDYTVDDSESFYLEIIKKIGMPFNSEEDFCTKNKTGNLWSDIRYIKDKSESFSHSNTRQPFHTDGAYESNAPDISFFYCVEKAKFGGSTTFVNLKKLIKCLYHYDKNLLHDLMNVEMNFSKGNDGKKTTILTNNGNTINWNYFRVEKNKITNKFHDFLENKIYQGGIYDSVCLKENESLFFWDSKILHGRNAFVGNRHLKKAGLHAV